MYDSGYPAQLSATSDERTATSFNIRRTISGETACNPFLKTMYCASASVATSRSAFAESSTLVISVFGTTPLISCGYLISVSQGRGAGLYLASSMASAQRCASVMRSSEQGRFVQIRNALLKVFVLQQARHILMPG